VTKENHISQVFKTISKELKKQKKKGLYAIINNAGGGFFSPIELMDIEKFKIEWETRIVGPIRLLQDFLPLIREGKGRILWIVTPAIIPIPFVGSIHICDFAVNCIVRTLKIELQKWKIPAIMIRCGGIKTSGVNKSYAQVERFFKTIPKEKLTLYKQDLEREIKELKEYNKKRTELVEVAKTIYKALCAKKPKSGYRVGYMSGMSAFFETFPQSFVDFIMARRFR